LTIVKIFSLSPGDAFSNFSHWPKGKADGFDSHTMGKTNPFVSSQARKVRKAYFNATKKEKHTALSAPLSKELQTAHGIKRLPIRRDDEVQVIRGKFKSRGGKVLAVKLRSMRITVDAVTRQKANESSVHCPLHPSNVVITKLKMDKYRKELIDKTKATREAALKKLGHT
jgi:large subunit ribosomal protein L26e